MTVKGLLRAPRVRRILPPSNLRSLDYFCVRETPAFAGVTVAGMVVKIIAASLAKFLFFCYRQHRYPRPAVGAGRSCCPRFTASSRQTVTLFGAMMPTRALPDRASRMTISMSSFSLNRWPRRLVITKMVGLLSFVKLLNQCVRMFNGPRRYFSGRIRLVAKIRRELNRKILPDRQTFAARGRIAGLRVIDGREG